MKKRRRVSRERLVQVLYAVASQRGDAELPTIEEMREIYPMDGEEDTSFSAKLFDAVIDNRTSIDGLIEGASRNWRIERMDFVDLAILRLGVAEIMWMGSPVPVVINEAVELAKLYGSEKSRRFVNGVLNKIAETHKEQ